MAKWMNREEYQGRNKVRSLLGKYEDVERSIRADIPDNKTDGVKTVDGIPDYYDTDVKFKLCAMDNDTELQLCAGPDKIVDERLDYYDAIPDAGLCAGGPEPDFFQTK